METLLGTLKSRFEENMHRHRDMDWNSLRARLEAAPDKIRSLQKMEDTGGEPDVVGQDARTGAYLFFDCAEESPKGRRSLCYDQRGSQSRKAHKPKNTAMDMATEMGIDLLTEEEYCKLQELGPVDMKTSSWLKTPSAVRELGGAIFGDRRFGRVFVYHNGAGAYYGARGFRGSLSV